MNNPVEQSWLESKKRQRELMNTRPDIYGPEDNRDITCLSDIEKYKHKKCPNCNEVLIWDGYVPEWKTSDFTCVNCDTNMAFNFEYGYFIYN